MDKTFLFLGTSAANFPLLRTGKYEGVFDKNARRSSCMLIGESFLVDCGMHTMDSLRIAQKDISKITDVFITHFHADHFNKDYVEEIAKGKSTPLRLWCRRNTEVPPMENVDIIKMEQGTYYHVAPGFNAKAVDANHEASSFPQHYVFDLDGKKVLYATDGAWMLESAFRYLKGAKLDVVILDATCGEELNERRLAEHNSLPMLRLLVPFMRTTDIIREDTKVYLTHIAPSLHKPHDEIQQQVQEDGFIVAYDGMTFEV